MPADVSCIIVYFKLFYWPGISCLESSWNKDSEQLYLYLVSSGLKVFRICDPEKWWVKLTMLPINQLEHLWNVSPCYNKQTNKCLYVPEKVWILKINMSGAVTTIGRLQQDFSASWQKGLWDFTSEKITACTMRNMKKRRSTEIQGGRALSRGICQHETHCSRSPWRRNSANYICIKMYFCFFLQAVKSLEDLISKQTTDFKGSKSTWRATKRVDLRRYSVDKNVFRLCDFSVCFDDLARCSSR